MRKINSGMEFTLPCGKFFIYLLLRQLWYKLSGVFNMGIRFIVQLCVVFLMFLSSSFADEYKLREAVEKAKSLHLTLPELEDDGRVRTLNKKGSMFQVQDMTSEAFLSSIKGKKVLEIGAAYGNILLKSLNLRFNKYVVNDLDPRHLFIAATRVKERIDEGLVESSVGENVLFVDCEFGVDCRFSSDSFDAILIARVLHFFTPEQITAGIKDLYRILKVKGQVYAIATTPYIKRYSKFIPEYERRVQNGDPFPGYVEKLGNYLDLSLISAEELKKVNNETFMFLDPVVLAREFKNAGFNVKVSKTVPLGYSSNIWQFDGREDVVVIAEKN